MHSLELTNLDKSWVYRPAMNAWSNDKQRFRPPDIRPIVPIESGRASLSEPLHWRSMRSIPRSHSASHTEVLAKWPPLRRQNFQMHLLGKILCILISMIFKFLLGRGWGEPNHVFHGALQWRHNEHDGVSIVYWSVWSGADQRKHQSPASLAFVRGIHRSPMDSPKKGQVTQKCFHLITSSCCARYRFSHSKFMMTSSNGNIFRVTGHLSVEFTGRRWILRTNASDAELWCFLWSASE